MEGDRPSVRFPAQALSNIAQGSAVLQQSGTAPMAATRSQGMDQLPQLRAQDPANRRSHLQSKSLPQKKMRERHSSVLGRTIEIACVDTGVLSPWDPLEVELRDLGPARRAFAGSHLRRGPLEDPGASSWRAC